MVHLLSPPVSPSDPLMWADFQALCDLGGRVAGSASEAAALAFARGRLAAVPGANVFIRLTLFPRSSARPSSTALSDDNLLKYL